MLPCLFASMVLISIFTAVAMASHSGRLATWLGLSYFSGLGLGVSAGAFAAVNMVLAGLAHEREAQGWFEVYAALGGLGASVLLVVIVILTLILRPRLSIPRVLGAALIMFMVMCGVFWGCSLSPYTNWW
jgi:hypothetical protein